MSPHEYQHEPEREPEQDDVPEADDVSAQDQPEDGEDEGEEPSAEPRPKSARGGIKWKRETRFGIAALLSFVILVTALIMNKGKAKPATRGSLASSTPTKKPPKSTAPVLSVPPPGTADPPAPPPKDDPTKSSDKELPSIPAEAPMPPAGEVQPVSGEQQDTTPPNDPGPTPPAPAPATEPSLPVGEPTPPAEDGKGLLPELPPDTTPAEPKDQAPPPAPPEGQGQGLAPATGQENQAAPPSGTAPAEGLPAPEGPPPASAPPDQTGPTIPAPPAAPPQTPAPVQPPAPARAPAASSPPPAASSPLQTKDVPTFSPPPGSDDPDASLGPPSFKAEAGIPIPTTGKNRGLDDDQGATEVAAPPGAVGKRVVVARGENFWTISKKYYGSGRYFKALWKANSRAVPDIKKLYIGTTIVVPPPEALDRSLIDPQKITNSPASRPPAPLRKTSGDSSRAGFPAGAAAPRTSDYQLMLPVDDAFAGERDTRQGPLEETRPRAAARPGPVYKVRANDNLRSIARRTLRDSKRHREILDLNRDVIDDPDNLVEGQILRLPGDALVGGRRR